MRKILLTFGLALLTVASGGAANAQTTPAAQEGGATSGIAPNYVLGDVMAIDAANNRLTIRTKVGDISAVLDEKTQYFRIPPGETTLKNKTPMKLAEITIGDRAMALGKVSDDKKSVPARQVIVISKIAIAQKQEHDREEWRRRGIVGTISALDPAAKTITVLVRSREGAKPVTVETGDSARFRRYAPDSVKFSDAKQSSFAELKVNDQVRALGNKSEDGAHLTAEEIVSGTFRTIAGTVVSADASTGEVKINDQQSKQSVTIVVNKDSMLRRFPAEMAARFAAGGQGGGAGGPGGPGGPGGERRPQGERGPGAGGDRPRGGGGFDIEQFLERMPETSVAELKPGDVILIASTQGSDPSRVTAIKLVAGAEPFLKFMQARQAMRAGRQGGGAPGAGGDAGMLGGLPDLGIGLP